MDILEEFLYQESVDQDDFDLAIAVETAELAVDRILLSCDMICEKANLDLREAELKCVQESGNANDLIRLYSEAEETSSEQKKNIFARAWEAIKNFWKRIVAFFKGEKVTASVNNINDTDELTAPKGLIGQIKTGLKWLSDHIANGASKLWKLLKDHPVADIGAAVTLVIGFCGILNSGKIKKSVEEVKANPANGEKVSGKDVVAVLKSIFDFSSSVESAIDEASKNEGEDKEESNKLIGILKAAGNAVMNLPKLLFGLPKKVAGKNKSVDTTNTSGNTNGGGGNNTSGNTNGGGGNNTSGNTNGGGGNNTSGNTNSGGKELRLEKSNPIGSAISAVQKLDLPDLAKDQLMDKLNDIDRNHKNKKQKREVVHLVKQVLSGYKIMFEAMFEENEMVGYTLTTEDGSSTTWNFYEESGELENENVNINDIFNEAFGEGGLDPEEDVATEAADDIDSLLDELFNEFV